MVTSGVVFSGLTAATILYSNSTHSTAMTAAEYGLHAPKFDWPHYSPCNTFDHASIRRGYQVYRDVCEACQSLDHVAWRNLVDISHTTEEVKEMSVQFDYDDEPDQQGNPRKR